MFQSLLAGGNFSLALLLMVVTNLAGVFSVPPMLVWMTDLNSRVNVARFGNIMLVFALITILPTIVSITVLRVTIIVDYRLIFRFSDNVHYFCARFKGLQ